MSTGFQHRQPKGIRIGGQYAATEHSEPGLRLGSPQDPAKAREAIAARHEMFTRSGFVPATTLPALNEPTTTEKREEWWDRNFVAAEYRHDKSYTRMPDDYTPARTGGNAMSGHRRTHRMNYGNKDVQLRMPSATAIKRFSQEHGNPTFDVPVSVQLNGGAPVTGWVRVTRTGPETWETTALGLGKGDNTDRVSEAVAAVLESRRPSMALTATGDLLEKRRARLAAQGTQMEPVRSSFLDSVGYNDANNTMTTRIGGRIYGHEVPRNLYEALKTSERPGAIFNRLIKQGNRVGVETCHQCGRIYPDGASHTCPTGHKPQSGIGLEHVEAARNRATAVSMSAVPRQPQAPPAPAPAADEEDPWLD